VSAKASFVVLPEHGPWTTLLDFFCARFIHIPAIEWQARFAAGLIQDEAENALAFDAPFALFARQKLRYFRAVATEQVIPFAAEIIYADEHIVVADKPHFLPVLPAGKYLEQTLLRRLQQQLDLPDLAPAHRIDQATAGLVLFTKTVAARGHYQRLFRERTITKTYLAVAAYSETLELPMRHSSRLVEATHFMQMMEVPGTPNCTTEIALLRRIDAHWALYQLTPISGKRHQLRAHLSALGIAIKNDTLYPILQTQTDTLDFSEPLQLLAQRLAFVDPISGAPRVFESRRRLLDQDVGPSQS
jgi:tRNA pseudouridine32 synthase / 23S rRNA pseudouridine746 synthase